jgi:2-(3-amino-3-carboxypropyl)histidine synthase
MLDTSIVEQKLKRKQGSIAKFYASDNIGVLVSTKPGQNFLKASLKLKQLYPKKNFYFIVNNNVDFSQLENFPFIECWINTACPRIGIDDVYKFQKPVVNLDDVAQGSMKTSIAFKAQFKK